MGNPPSRRATVWMAIAGLVSWLGELVHNRMELPQLTLASPENLLPLLVTVGLLVAYRWGPRRPATWGLLVWGLLHLLVGGVLTVLPLPILPFSPDQTLTHYGAHVVYSIAQVPLVALAWREIQHPEVMGTFGDG